MPYPPNDGGAIATLNMIKGFEQKGDTVTVLTMKTHKHTFSIRDLPLSIRNSIAWHQVDVNTRINPIKALLNLLFSKEPYNAVRFNSDEFATKLKDLLQKNNYDIIQLEGLYLYMYYDIIRHYTKSKISLRAHNIEHEIWERLAKNESNFFKKIYLQEISSRVKKVELNFIKKVDLLIPISHRDAKVLNSNNRTFVSPTGIENKKIKYSNPIYKKTIFYIGALDWVPNQEALIWFLENVWSDINKEFKEWDFVIAGRNASGKFEKDIIRYNIKYLGEVDDAIKFIDEHNVMVVPLMSGSGMRIKIIEGMARGKCILTTSVGIEGISAKNNKEVFIVDSAKEYKEILSEIMKKSDKIDICRKNAFTFVQKEYNNENVIHNLRSFYLENL